MVGRQMPPLPAPKTKILAIETKKQDGKGRVESANSGASASGRPMPLPVLKPKVPGDRSQEAGRQSQSGVRQPRRERDRQADAVAGAEIEDPGDRGQETGRQRQSGVRQRRRGWESGGKVGPASRPHAKELPVIFLIWPQRRLSALGDYKTRQPAASQRLQPGRRRAVRGPRRQGPRAARRDGAAVRDIAEETGIARSTVHRLKKKLERDAEMEAVGTDKVEPAQ